MGIIQDALPPVSAHYEGRWIINQDGGVDIVWDRHGIEGGVVSREEIARWVESTDCIKKARATLSDRLYHYDLLTTDAGWRFLYEDQDGAILGNPNRSHGYIYVIGYMFKHLPEGHPTKGYEKNVMNHLTSSEK